MIETKIRKSTFKHIESELFAYHDTRKEIIKLKNEIIYASAPPNNTGGGRSNTPSDPTERTVAAILTDRRIQHLQSVVDAIEGVYERLPRDKKNLIHLYYWAKPKMLTWDGIADKLHVSGRQAQRWRDEIVQAISEKIGWR
jgi:RinA family phage transcriptional activator